MGRKRNEMEEFSRALEVLLAGDDAVSGAAGGPLYEHSASCLPPDAERKRRPVKPVDKCRRVLYNRCWVKN